MKPELTLVQNSEPAAAVAAPVKGAAPAQAEMPFAVVEGQPVTEMPRDLYIPPQAICSDACHVFVNGRQFFMLRQNSAIR